MKKLLLAGFFAVITLNIPDEEIAIVENDVISAEAWLKEAWAGKVNKCSERLINTEIQTSLNESSTIPKTKEGIINKHLKRPGYKNRAERDKELSQ